MRAAGNQHDWPTSRRGMETLRVRDAVCSKRDGREPFQLFFMGLRIDILRWMKSRLDAFRHHSVDISALAFAPQKLQISPA
jgi:hypothetical protein